MALILFGLLVAFSLDSAAKCDDYVVGNVWEHKGGADDVNKTFQGCKKGCFWNKTYTEMGVRKCEKCEDITDEITCTNNDATCRWKGGKCKPQSCPEIANTRNTGAFVFNNTEAAVSKGRARLLKECVEGSELEKKFNNQYWEDYKEKVNWQYYEDNCPTTIDVDTCTNPCSAPGQVDESTCHGFFGGICVWTDGGGTGTPRLGTCQKAYGCYGSNATECARLSGAGCTWTPPDPGSGAAGSCGGSLSYYSYRISCTDFVPGKHNRKHCERLGCEYSSGSGSNDLLTVSFEDTCTYRPFSTDTTCLGFTPGGTTLEAQTRCRSLGCTYQTSNGNPSTTTQSVGCGEFKTVCPNTDTKPPSIECRKNASYALDEPGSIATNTLLPYSCFDRTYPFNENVAPSVQTNGECRLLPDIERQRCVFNYESLLSVEKIYVNGVNDSGGFRWGTLYESCLQTQNSLLEPYAIVKDSDGYTEPAKMSEENRQKLYGYSSPTDYCDAEKDREIAICQKAYEKKVDSCFGYGDYNALQPADLFRNHVQTKAARAACNEIYGCMYDEKNERCSAWAVWALVLTIVLVVVVVVAALAVVGVFILLKVVKSKA